MECFQAHNSKWVFILFLKGMLHIQRGCRSLGLRGLRGEKNFNEFLEPFLFFLLRKTQVFFRRETSGFSRGNPRVPASFPRNRLPALSVFVVIGPSKRQTGASLPLQRGKKIGWILTPPPK